MRRPDLLAFERESVPYPASDGTRGADACRLAPTPAYRAVRADARRTVPEGITGADGRPLHGNGCNVFDSTTFWVVLFGLPILAIVVIILLASHHASGVQQDGRDDTPDDDASTS